MGQVSNKQHKAGTNRGGRGACREPVTIGDLPCGAATRSNGLEAIARGDPLCVAATRSYGLEAIARSVPGGSGSLIASRYRVRGLLAHGTTRPQVAGAMPTGDRNAQMAQAKQLLRQSPYWPRAQQVEDGEASDNRVQRPVNRKWHETMRQAIGILRQSPYATEARNTDQGNKSQELNHGETTVKSAPRRQGDLEEAGNVLGFWDTNYTVGKEELHAYLHGYSREEKATVLGYWAVEARATDVETDRFRGAGDEAHGRRRSRGHRYGLHAAARGSALAQIHPNQGHVVEETQVSGDTHFMRASSTTFHAHREQLDGTQDRDRVDRRIKQGQPDVPAPAVATSDQISPSSVVAAGAGVPHENAANNRSHGEDNRSQEGDDRSQVEKDHESQESKDNESQARGNRAKKLQARGNIARRPQRNNRENKSQYRESYNKQQVEYCGVLTYCDWKGTFEGTADEDVHLFLDEFEVFCAANNADKEQYAGLLRLKLKGFARTMVASMTSADRASYEKIKERLISSFDRADRYLVAREKIQGMSYKAPIGEFIAVLGELMHKAYPEHSQEVRDVKTYDIIMDRVPVDVRIELKRSKCNTLEDLRQKGPEVEALVREIEHISTRTQQAIPQMVATAYTPVNQTVEVLPPSYRRDAGQVYTNQVGEVKPQGYDTGYMPNPEHLPQDTYQRWETNYGNNEEEQCFNTNQQLAPQHGDYEGYEAYEEQNENEEDTRVCDYCGRPGHVAFRCWHNPNGENYRSNWGPNRQDSAAQRVCWHCQQPGHFARDCVCAMQEEQMEDLANQLRHLQMAQQQQGPTVQHVQTAQGNTNGTSIGTQQTGNTQAGARQQGPRHEYTNTVTLGRKIATPTRKYSNEDIHRWKRPMSNPGDKLRASNKIQTERVGPRDHTLGAEQRQVVVPLSINGYAQTGLIDTGSTVTIGSISMAKTLGIRLKDTSRLIKGVSGDTTVVSKTGIARLTIAGHTREVEMCFRDKDVDRACTYEVIVGVDVLQHFPPFSINIGKRSFTMGANTTRWQTRSEMPQQQEATNEGPATRANKANREDGNEQQDRNRAEMRRKPEHQQVARR